MARVLVSCHVFVGIHDVCNLRLRTWIGSHRYDVRVDLQQKVACYRIYGT
jgi:hypothetical protein